ncbi:hypothetical protein IWQ61_010704 [Dispira simplex]|nr:hypothetical protein IWQ61_010704 [Dispira simplex]
MVAVVLDYSELESSGDKFQGSDKDLNNSDDDLSDDGVNDVELDHVVKPNGHTTGEIIKASLPTGKAVIQHAVPSLFTPIISPDEQQQDPTILKWHTLCQEQQQLNLADNAFFSKVSQMKTENDLLYHL